jgi:uncharacterized protein (DUF2344 family)
VVKNSLAETLQAYKTKAEMVKGLEAEIKALKSAIVDEMDINGVKVLEAGDYVACLSTHNRENLSLAETLKEFGREILEAKNLLHSSPVNVLKVSKK